MPIKKRVAIVGAGIAGLGCAYALRQSALIELTVFEGGDHLGGHSNTLDIEIKTPTGIISQALIPDF